MRTAHTSQLKKCSNKPPKQKEINWFDEECQQKRKELRKIWNQKHRDPSNADVRLLDMLKQYKRTIKIKKAQYTQKQLTIIEESLNTNRFWEHWKNRSKSKHDDPVIQNGDIWTDHFKHLYGNIPINSDSEQTQIIEKFNNLEWVIKDSQNPLDFLITEQELEKKLINLKPKKASGLDGILNEMLKHSSKKIRLAILKLFNLILIVGYFPDCWNRGLITPILQNRR